MTRPRGFIEWAPRNDTQLVVNNVKAVLQEYHQYLPMTIRQVFYRLVAEYDYDKTERAYKRLVEYIGKARRAELIPMSAIRDDGFHQTPLYPVADLDDAAARCRNYAEHLTLDRQGGQDAPLVLWCEAKGMVPMLEGLARPYGIPVASSGGFDSITAQHNMGRHLAGTNATVLHLGDYDPSGEHVYTALAENLLAFAGGYSNFFCFAEVERIAVLPEQVENYGLPTAPPKATDNRSFSGIATTQLEAFAPDQLLALVRGEIESRMDLDIYQQVLADEDAMRNELMERMA